MIYLDLPTNAQVKEKLRVTLMGVVLGCCFIQSMTAFSIR